MTPFDSAPAPKESENSKFLRLLHLIDEHPDIDCSSFEADFLESVFTQTFPLTPKQIVVATRMIAKYGPTL